MEILLLRMFAILFRRYSMETLKCAEECTFVIISNFVHDFVNSQFIVVSHFMPMMIFFMILLLECKTLKNKGFDLDFTIK